MWQSSAGDKQRWQSDISFVAAPIFRFVILDEQDAPGGAWLQGWNSLRLFSPARWSSLPGWGFPPHPDLPDLADLPGASELPTRDDVIRYLSAYEQRYDLPVQRPVRVHAVRNADSDNTLAVDMDHGTWSARTVVSATGTWSKPYIPHYTGQEEFQGEQLHSARYRSADGWMGKRVLVIGGGNSGAQILAEVSRTTEAIWVTVSPPRYLPDDVDGSVLFEQANREFAASQQTPTRLTEVPARENPLASIVMVPSVQEARERGILQESNKKSGVYACQLQ